MMPTAISWAEFERRAQATVLEVLAAFRDEGDEMLAGIIADNVASLVDDIWGLEADKGVMPLTEMITPGYQFPSR